MDSSIKLFFSVVAAILTFMAFLPYLMSILKNRTRPHVFSWVIWGITTLIVFFAQLQSDAGWGAWPIGLSALITLLVALEEYSIATALFPAAINLACLVLLCIVLYRRQQFRTIK